MKNDSIESLASLFGTTSAPKKRGRPRIHAEGETDKRKQSLYFAGNMIDEIKAEAERLDRSFSWVIQKAWKIARAEIQKLPSATSEDNDD